MDVQGTAATEKGIEMKYIPLTVLLALIWSSGALHADCNGTSTGLAPLTDVGQYSWRHEIGGGAKPAKDT